MKSNQNIPLKSILKKLSVLRKPVLLILLLLCAYLLGYGIGYLTSDNFRTLPGSSSVQSASGGASSGNWGLSFQEEGQCPQGNASIEELAEYNAYYAQDTEEKVLYLTFDAGYENGNTETILNALKKHNVSATFFVVGTYIESEPELIQRMIDEGHTVGNHTWHHPNMSGIETMEEFKKDSPVSDAAMWNRWRRKIRLCSRTADHMTVMSSSWRQISTAETMSGRARLSWRALRECSETMRRRK